MSPGTEVALFITIISQNITRLPDLDSSEVRNWMDNQYQSPTLLTSLNLSFVLFISKVKIFVEIELQVFKVCVWVSTCICYVYVHVLVYVCKYFCVGMIIDLSIVLPVFLISKSVFKPLDQFWNILISICLGVLFVYRITNCCFSGHQFSQIKNFNHY